MVQTLRNYFEGYTKKQFEKDILDNTVQVIIGHPTEDNFKKILVQKILTNSPVILDYITNSHTLFGLQREVLQEKH